MMIMIEGENSMSTYGVKEINREIQSAVKAARRGANMAGVRHDALQTHLTVTKEGKAILHVGLLLPDGWRTQHSIQL
jgi:hypothetical protein